MVNKTAAWYSSWFDTPFYHILYKDRDASEAQAFMNTLTNYLNIPEGGSILDLACGRGRHARFLNKMGFDVTGADLSENSINYAKQYENHRLRFVVHDMSRPLGKSFDAIFNLFTSFGYFENDINNLNTIKAIKADLNTFGFGVIDFMNSQFVMDSLVPEESKMINGIEFQLKRHIKEGYIFKDIAFKTQGEEFNFTERVKAFSLNDFELLFEQADVNLLDVFGDYKLNAFDAGTSERLIMIFK